MSIENCKFIKVPFIFCTAVLMALLSVSCCIWSDNEARINAETSRQASISTEDKIAEGKTAEDKIMEAEAAGPQSFENFIGSEIVKLEISYMITITGDTRKIEFTSTIPADYKYRQKIKSYSYSVEPSKIFSLNGNKYAKFIIKDPPDYFSIDIVAEMEIYDLDLEWILNNKKEIPGENLKLDEALDPGELKKYLKSESGIDVGNDALEGAALSFLEKDRLGLVREVYDFVLSNMSYHGYNPDSKGAAEAFIDGGGDCTEYSDLFVTLCRIKNIPARVVEGYVTDAAPDSLSLGHNWSEAYIDEIGWIPFDTIYDDNNGEDTSTTFENLKNIYIYTSFVRNDAELLYYHYYSYLYYGDNIEVEKRVNVLQI